MGNNIVADIQNTTDDIMEDAIQQDTQQEIARFIDNLEGFVKGTPENPRPVYADSIPASIATLHNPPDQESEHAVLIAYGFNQELSDNEHEMTQPDDYIHNQVLDDIHDHDYENLINTLHGINFNNQITNESLSIHSDRSQTEGNNQLDEEFQDEYEAETWQWLENINLNDILRMSGKCLYIGSVQV